MTMYFLADHHHHPFNYNSSSRLVVLGGFDVMSQLSSSSTSTEPAGSNHLPINNNNNNNNNIVCPILMADDDVSSSKTIVPGGDDDDEWLQLSIGSAHNSSNLVELDLMPSTTTCTSLIKNNNNNDSQILGRMPEFRPPVTTLMSPYNLLQQQQQHNYNPAGIGMTNFMPHHHHHQEINWALIRPIPISISAAAAAAVPSSSGTYFQAATAYVGGGGVDNMAASLDFRVIQPPRRPHSGIWFMLQASLNQEKQPFLPQISKSYLRIKDGRMVIRLVIKYLANKLRLENESEIELRCKGQKLEPFLTLQHVRDKIWSNNPRDFITLLPNSSTTHQIMVLHYARNASN